MPLSECENTFADQESNADLIHSDGSYSNDSSISSYSTSQLSEIEKDYLLYTSFVRCVWYLERIKQNAVRGRQPPARSVVSSRTGTEDYKHLLLDSPCIERWKKWKEENMGVLDDVRDWKGKFNNPLKRPRLSKDCAEMKPQKKLRRSMMGHRHLGPTLSGQIDVAKLELPGHFAIYSIHNWMVAFSNVEGIQILCLKALPFLLEDERHRSIARETRLADVVIQGMVTFPDCMELHTASFHCIVLLARPLGGKDGMLSRRSILNETGIFCGGHKSNGMCNEDAHEKGANNIAIMLDSMRRFIDDAALQAMGCWSLVNIALVAEQKEIVIELGGIDVTANAMMKHSNNENVQFRGLLALVNLVNPLSHENREKMQKQSVEETTCKEKKYDQTLDRIVHLVVRAMTKLCGSEPILQKGCSVLHNISLAKEHHPLLLRTPNCYQMLDWCVTNYWTNRIMQQQASNIIRRLQTTMSNNDDLREEFEASIRAQKKQSMEKAHSEAFRLQIWQQLLEKQEDFDESD